SGHDPGDPSSSRAPVPDYVAAIARRRPPRIGLLREFFFERASAEVGRITTQAVDRLARAGAAVEEAQIPASLRVAQAAAARTPSWLPTAPQTALICSRRKPTSTGRRSGA